MDGEFTCPECGQTVKARPSESGRQVRCSFCNRMLEVPFIPRVSTGWRRGAVGRPPWMIWAWLAVGFVAVSLISVAAMRLILSQERAARAVKIDRLIGSSEAHEKAGRLDMALLDLDTALEYLPSAAPARADDLQKLRDRRRTLAIRDLRATIDRLEGRGSEALGDWLNVQARVEADPDLRSAAGAARGEFRAVLHQWIAARTANADAATRSQRPAAAVAECQVAAGLAAHLPPDEKIAVMERLAAIVVPQIEQCGVVVERPAGAFVFGTDAGYSRALSPAAERALEGKGYLPRDPNTHWRDEWSRAPYRLSLSIHERHEGTYMATENRLTRIEVDVALRRQGGEVWKSTPSARTTVPLPRVPSFLATRLALSAERLPDVEKMLYEDARSRLDDRFRAVLEGLPQCPRPSLPAVARDP